MRSARIRRVWAAALTIGAAALATEPRTTTTRLPDLSPDARALPVSGPETDPCRDGDVPARPHHVGRVINVDMGSQRSSPPTTFGGVAGAPGLWNVIDGYTVNEIELLDDAGRPTCLTFRMNLPYGSVSFDHPGTSGDTAALLDDYLDLLNTPGVHSIAGLEPGRYELIVYAWAPDADFALTFVGLEGEPESDQLIGGAWPGAPEPGITHARFRVDVQPGETLRFLTFGAPVGTLNGFQLVRVSCLQDITTDGSVDDQDLLTVLDAWGTAGGDLNGDATTDEGDLLDVFSAWGDCRELGL